MKDELGGVRHALNSDSAHTLGFAGRKLRDALAALAPNPANPALLAAAADALWAYVVQKELLHLADDAMVNRVYRVPPEVWTAMGRRHPDAR